MISKKPSVDPYTVVPPPFYVSKVFLNSLYSRCHCLLGGYHLPLLFHQRDENVGTLGFFRNVLLLPIECVAYCHWSYIVF